MSRKEPPRYTPTEQEESSSEQSQSELSSVSETEASVYQPTKTSSKREQRDLGELPSEQSREALVRERDSLVLAPDTSFASIPPKRQKTYNFSKLPNPKKKREEDKGKEIARLEREQKRLKLQNKSLKLARKAFELEREELLDKQVVLIEQNKALLEEKEVIDLRSSSSEEDRKPAAVETKQEAKPKPIWNPAKINIPEEPETESIEDSSLEKRDWFQKYPTRLDKRVQLDRHLAARETTLKGLRELYSCFVDRTVWYFDILKDHISRDRAVEVTKEFGHSIKETVTKVVDSIQSEIFRRTKEGYKIPEGHPVLELELNPEREFDKFYLRRSKEFQDFVSTQSELSERPSTVVDQVEKPHPCVQRNFSKSKSKVYKGAGIRITIATLSDSEGSDIELIVTTKKREAGKSIDKKSWKANKKSRNQEESE